MRSLTQNQNQISFSTSAISEFKRKNTNWHGTFQIGWQLAFILHAMAVLMLPKFRPPTELTAINLVTQVMTNAMKCVDMARFRYSYRDADFFEIHLNAERHLWTRTITTKAATTFSASSFAGLKYEWHSHVSNQSKSVLITISTEIPEEFLVRISTLSNNFIIKW